MFNLLLLLLSTSYNNCKRCLRAIVDPSSLRILSNDNYVNKCGHYSNSNNNHHHYNNHLIIFQQCARVLPYEKSSSHSMEGREGDFKLNNNNSSTRRKNDPNKSTNRTNHNSISSSFSPSTTTTTETLIPVKQSPQTSDRSIVSNVLPKSAAQFGVSNICLLLLFLVNPIHCGHSVHCGHLLIGQYRCPQPEIDVLTQQVSGCTENNTAPIVCSLAPQIFCLPGTGINETHFISHVACEWTNGYSFELSLLLSVFLGWLGLDRLYLGYPGLALAKFCTLGGIFLWQLIDIVLIAMQVVRPADGSQYIVAYFGPKLTRLFLDNDTQILAQDDW